MTQSTLPLTPFLIPLGYHWLKNTNKVIFLFLKKGNVNIFDFDLEYKVGGI